MTSDHIAVKASEMSCSGCSVLPIAVVMISYNEAHNMESVLDNLSGFAKEVFLVDSYSTDRTVDIALNHGVYVIQRRFISFGDQWNFAVRELPITAPWTMKLDPDERLSDNLKLGIADAITRSNADVWRVRRRLWFMGRQLPVVQVIVRGWRTGKCRFSDVLVNEHPIVHGRIVEIRGELEHYDSPDLHHWFEKQNRYSSAEALSAFRGSTLSAAPSLLGSPLQRRMWLKARMLLLPFWPLMVFIYFYVWQGSWRAGRVGFIWARLRVFVYRCRAIKLLEMRIRGAELSIPLNVVGDPHPGAKQWTGDDRLEVGGRE